MPTTNLSKATQLIAEFEGFSSVPYKDSIGKPTIGYGTTLYPSGVRVEMTDPVCTKPMALSWLQFWIACVADELGPYITKEPTVNQWSALLSLAYNVGSHSVIHSTLLKLFNSGHIEEASKQFPIWDHATIQGHLVELKGLKTRRLKEQELFLTKDI